MPTPPDAAVVHHVPPRQKRGREPVNMQINLAAMIDVIFLLLVYFVVTANFAVDEGVLTAKLPQGAGAPRGAELKPPPQPLNIVLRSIDPAGVEISINDARLAENFSDLYRLLTELRGSVYTADNPVIVQPRGDVRWQHVVNAFNAAVRANYTNISFATVDQEAVDEPTDAPKL